MIPLSLLVVLPVVSSAIFLPVCPLSYSCWIRLELLAPQPWLFVSPWWWRRRPLDEEREGAGKHALLIKLQARRNGLPRPQVPVCRIHKGETKRLRRTEPKIAYRRESILEPIGRGWACTRATRRSPWLTLAHPAHKMQVFKVALCG